MAVAVVGVEERNRETVERFVEAFRSGDPGYEQYLGESPTWRSGHTVYTGRAGVADLAGRLAALFPDGLAECRVEVVVAEARQVGLQAAVRAITASGDEYQNLHAIVFELDDDGHIVRVFDHFDTAHAVDQLGVSEPPDPAPDLVGNAVVRNKQTTVAFFDAFLTWDPEQYERYLTDEPTYQGGRSVMPGRAAFRGIAGLAAHLYPNGLKYEIESLFGQANRTFLRLTVRATPNRGIPYENHYAMVFEFDDDGRIAKQSEYTDTAYARRRFDYPTEWS